MTQQSEFEATGGTATFTGQPTAARQERAYWHHVARKAAGQLCHKQVAAVATINNQRRVVAFKWLKEGATEAEDYTWINIDKGSKLPRVPYRDGGKLLYDQMLLLHNAQENAPAVSIIERNANGGFPIYQYGSVLSSNNRVNNNTYTGMQFNYENFLLRRAQVVQRVVTEFASTNWAVFDVVQNTNVRPTQDRDYRTRLWYALGLNWIMAAAFMGNSLSGNVDTLIRGVNKWNFLDFYNRIHEDDYDGADPVRQANVGLKFFYLEQDTESDKIRLRNTTDVKIGPIYCKQWAQNLLYRHPTHLLEHVWNHHHNAPNY